MGVLLVYLSTHTSKVGSSPVAWAYNATDLREAVRHVQAAAADPPAWVSLPVLAVVVVADPPVWVALPVLAVVKERGPRAEALRERGSGTISRAAKPPGSVRADDEGDLQRFWVGGCTRLCTCMCACVGVYVVRVCACRWMQVWGCGCGCAGGGVRNTYLDEQD